jgi:hypothetical protein
MFEVLLQNSMISQKSLGHFSHGLAGPEFRRPRKTGFQPQKRHYRNIPT